MTDSIAERVLAMEPDDLASIVRNAIGNRSAQLCSDWTIQRSGGLFNGNGTLGLWRVSGGAVSEGKERGWSIVLKVFALDQDRGWGHDQPRREIEVYRSRFCYASKAGMRPALCYGIQEFDNGQVWLWIEDLSGAVGPPWSDDQYLTAAREIGLFNGYWLHRSLPKEPWLARDAVITRIRDSATEPCVAWLKEMRQDPTVQQVFPGKMYDRVLRTWDEARAVDGVLARIPHTLAHGDCHVRNLFLSESHDNPCVVAIDWAAAGIEPLGVDAGTLLGSGFTWRAAEWEQSKRLIEPIFESYVEGLQAAGWNGCIEHARLGYLAAAGLVYGGIGGLLAIPLIASGIYADRIEWLEHRTGASIDQLPERVSKTVDALFPLIEETLSIAERIGSLPASR